MKRDTSNNHTLLITKELIVTYKKQFIYTRQENH